MKKACTLSLVFVSSLVILFLLGCTQQQPAATATCSDDIKNQDETSIDCGGSCKPCAEGSACTTNSDCGSGSCESNKCVVKLDCDKEGLIKEGETRAYSIEETTYKVKAKSIGQDTAEFVVEDESTPALKVRETYTMANKNKITLKSVAVSQENEKYAEFCLKVVPPEKKKCLVGDANSDNVINETDKDLIFKMTKGARLQPILNNICCVDTSKDGGVSMQDITHLYPLLSGEKQPETCEYT